MENPDVRGRGWFWKFGRTRTGGRGGVLKIRYFSGRPLQTALTIVQIVPLQMNWVRIIFSLKNKLILMTHPKVFNVDEELNLYFSARRININADPWLIESTPKPVPYNQQSRHWNQRTLSNFLDQQDTQAYPLLHQNFELVIACFRQTRTEKHWIHWSWTTMLYLIGWNTGVGQPWFIW